MKEYNENFKFVFPLELELNKAFDIIWIQKNEINCLFCGIDGRIIKDKCYIYIISLAFYQCEFNIDNDINWMDFKTDNKELFMRKKMCNEDDLLNKKEKNEKKILEYYLKKLDFKVNLKKYMMIELFKFIRLSRIL